MLPIATTMSVEHSSIRAGGKLFFRSLLLTFTLQLLPIAFPILSLALLSVSSWNNLFTKKMSP